MILSYPSPNFSSQFLRGGLNEIFASNVNIINFPLNQSILVRPTTETGGESNRVTIKTKNRSMIMI